MTIKLILLAFVVIGALVAVKQARRAMRRA
jgi:hypothetical protein